jgi:small subunit ribosomal protein S16
VARVLLTTKGLLWAVCGSHPSPKPGEGWDTRSTDSRGGCPYVVRDGSSLRSFVRLECRIQDKGKETSSVLMIRLARVGARKQPHYRVVVIEKERARNGRPVEIVGTYNPRTTPASVELKRERIDYWRSKGAQVSSRVDKILGFAPSAPAEPVAS